MWWGKQNELTEEGTELHLLVLANCKLQKWAVRLNAGALFKINHFQHRNWFFTNSLFGISPQNCVELGM